MRDPALGSTIVELIIIRHGRPVRHVVDNDDEVANPGLSDIGREQAVRTADLLESQGVDHIVSSTMNRAARRSVTPSA